MRPGSNLTHFSPGADTGMGRKQDRQTRLTLCGSMGISLCYGNRRIAADTSCQSENALRLQFRRNSPGIIDPITEQFVAAVNCKWCYADGEYIPDGNSYTKYCESIVTI